MTEVNATAEGMACYIMKGPADIKQYVGVCVCCATEYVTARSNAIHSCIQLLLLCVEVPSGRHVCHVSRVVSGRHHPEQDE